MKIWRLKTFLLETAWLLRLASGCISWYSKQLYAVSDLIIKCALSVSTVDHRAFRAWVCQGSAANLPNLHLHQSRYSGKIVPSSNDTCWKVLSSNCSVCIAALDQVKMNMLLRKRGHRNIKLSTKELHQLHDIVSILEPFASVHCLFPQLTNMHSDFGLLGKCMHQSALSGHPMNR